MTKFPLIGGAILVASLLIGGGGSQLALAHDDVLLAAFAAFVGLMGILSGGMVMRWGADR